MLAKFVKFINPVFYVTAAKANYVKAVQNTAKSFREGSVAPLFKSMLIIGSVGYALEYYLDGSKLTVFTVLWARIWTFVPHNLYAHILFSMRRCIFVPNHHTPMSLS